MIVETLHAVMLRMAEKKEPSAYYPRPSNSGPEVCIRQLVYRANRIEGEPLPGRALGVFADGKAHEKMTADRINESAFKLESDQMKVNLRYNGRTITGSIDGTVKDPEGVERHYEHKSMNHFTFQGYWDGEGSLLPLDYVCQCCLYMAGILQDASSDIVECHLVIKNKNTDHYIEYLIEYHPDVALIKEFARSDKERWDINQLIYFPVAYCFDKYDRIDAHVAAKTLPPRQYDMTHWRCSYCPFQEPCWEGYEDEYEKLASDVAMENDFIDLCQYYLEADGHEKAAKAEVKPYTDEKQDLKKQVMDLMVKRGVKDGRVGEYVLKLSLVKYEKVIDMGLVPRENIKTTMSQRVNIRKPKPKGGKNGKQ